jgi:exosortase/archaeosortase family protein
MMKRLRAFLKSQWLTIRVVGIFVLLIAGFFSLLTYTPLVQRFDLAWTVARAIAWLSGRVLWVVGLIGGFPVVVDGTFLAFGGFRVDVSPGCSGVVPTMIYLSAVFAYPTSWRSKAIGTALGIAIILSVNLLRVVVLFLIGVFAREYFHDTHVYVAQALVVAIAAATWLFWAGRFADAPGN